MKFLKICATFLIFTFLTTSFLCENEDWGFFAHRRINRLAVFTLHPHLIGFYKKHIEYITAHATDPDMRRYIIPHEGQKHFIDLDKWYAQPLPLDFRDLRQLFVETHIINKENDTLRIFGKSIEQEDDWNIIIKGDNLPTFFGKDSLVMLADDYIEFYQRNIFQPQYFEKWKLDCDSLTAFFNLHGFELDCQKAFAVDTFVQHGVLPYNLVKMQNDLKYAMLEENLDRILRISADLGHYIGDAHVPLHTHSNYNGQETDQLGIHAFWETRLPEMFADNDYDFFVGQSEYIYEIEEHYWNIVNESHHLVNEVLTLEKELSKSYPEDQQYCFVERGEGYIQKMACEEYAKLYHEKLEGQVEKRFRDAIKAVGDAWYTAWVDAGQPDLETTFDNRNKKMDKMEEEALKEMSKLGKIIGRTHEGSRQ